MNSGEIKDCCSYAQILSSAVGTDSIDYAGGICGNNSGDLSQCRNYADVSSESESKESYSGGICGYNSKELSNCANYGNISSESKAVIAYSGGICGNNTAEIIKNCFNNGEINSSSEKNSYSGGITGNTNATSNISNVYNSGLVKTGELKGGISGYGSANVVLKNCFCLDSASEKGIGNVKTDDAVIISDKDMKTAEFADKLGSAYSYRKNSYPILADMADIPTNKNVTVYPKEMPVVTTAPPFIPVTTTTTINAKSEFTWGEDNFSFCNTRQYFRTTESEKFDLLDKYRNALRQNMSNDEWQKIVDAFDNDTDGDCYGMTVLAILAHEGIVPYDMFTKGAKCLNDLEAPVDNDEIKSLVHYYQLLSFKNSVLDNAAETKKKTNKENIKSILDQVENSHMVAVCFRRGALSHVVAAYDVTYGEYTFNDAEYQGKIEILDPTFSLKQDDRWCLYFNTATYDWIIPGYKCDSTDGAIFTNILYGTDMLNDGGYLGYTNSAKN